MGIIFSFFKKHQEDDMVNGNIILQMTSNDEDSIIMEYSESESEYDYETEDALSDVFELIMEHDNIMIDEVINDEENDTEEDSSKNCIFTHDNSKLALLIGINYIKNNKANDDLNGCINDVYNLQKMLKNNCHFEDHNIKTLLNGKATKENIINEIERLVYFSHVHYNSEIWFSYSGHGGGKFSRNENDFQSEFICPSDYLSNGLIDDKWIRENFINKLHPSTKCFVIMDCCNSGSNMNLPYYYSSSYKPECDESLCKIIKISGSKDSQTSADYFDGESNSFQGALTNSFLKTISLNEDILTHYLETKTLLKDRKFTQIPDLSYSDSKLIRYSLY